MTKLLFKNTITELVFILKHAYLSRIILEIWGYHGGKYKDSLLRKCDAVILVNMCY
jgi:hypothetical protein